MSNQTYTTYQVAERLGLSVRRIQALITTGLLEANKVGRDWVIPEEEVQRYRQQERLVGRPRKKRTEVVRSFSDHPSEIYLLVVETIRTLMAKEGLDAAYRAFSEAAWKRIREEVMHGFKPKGLAHICVQRLLGKKRCPDSYEHPCNSPDMPGRDHLSEWVQDGKTSKIVSQPYNLSYETLKELVEYCEKRGLRADISAESWHFPGKTIRVDFSLNKQRADSN
jgi:excisionase family DNA binding protein